MTIDSPELLMCCIFILKVFFWTLMCSLAHFWSLWADLGAYGLTFEGLGLTLEAHGITLGAFELQFSSPWGHLGSYWLGFGVSWVLKVVQNAPRMPSC